MTVLVSDKTDFMSKTITRDTGGHYYTNKRFNSLQKYKL